jgi:hypothetical protein
LNKSVFHVTTFNSYKKILKSKFIKPNGNNKFKFNHEVSARNFGIKNNYICLVDLRNVTKLEIKESFKKFYFLHPNTFDKYTIFLLISPSIYKDVIIQKQVINKLKIGTMFVPKIESWYPSKIPIEKITTSIIVKRTLEIEIKSFSDLTYMASLQESRNSDPK